MPPPATPDCRTRCRRDDQPVAESTEIAFRVKFDGARRATTSFTGAASVRHVQRSRVGAAAKRLVEAPPASIQGDARSTRSYTVTLEPHNRDWLFALDAPATLPVTNEFTYAPDTGNADRHQRSGCQRCATTCVRTPLTVNADASEAERRNWLQLPSTYNPRTLQLADEIRSRSGNDADRVRATLEQHLRRRIRVHADHAPGPKLDRRVFVRHAAGLLRTLCVGVRLLMRALDVPARVVTGCGSSIRSTAS